MAPGFVDGTDWNWVTRWTNRLLVDFHEHRPPLIQTMTTRSLVVTGLQLKALDRNVHGAYQRLRTLLDAVRGVCDVVEVFSPVTRDPFGAEADAAATEELRKWWGMDCAVYCGMYVKPQIARPWIREQLRWVTGYRANVLLAGYDNSANCQRLRELLDRTPQLVVTHKLLANELVRPLLPPDVPVLFDLDDVEYIAFQRHARQIASRRDRWISLAMVPGVRRTVRLAAKRASHTLVCSALDARRLQKDLQLPEGNAQCIPNSYVMHEISPSAAGPELLFVGTFAYMPNQHAVEFFLRECWPLVRRALPGAKLRVVGARPEVVPISANPPEGVEFAGFVPDISEAYRRARVVICPIISGGGTRVKLVEAAAYGKPIVSTVVGAEGLDFEDGVHALLRDGAEEFAAACIALLNDDARCAQLGEAAHMHARARFDRDSVVAAIRELARRQLDSRLRRS